ncbi:MAG: response regulator [Thermoleophilia bacterium]|nr:response regulator [Thermoleophilia bacterium]
MKVLHDITVLVAEDERPVRMLLRVVLESAGARVIEAENGAVALRLLDLHPDVDVLCTDVNMPSMNGEALVSAARTRRSMLPVVACTAMDLGESYPLLARVSDAVVQKPFVPSDLVRAITTALASADGAPAAAS